jgi:hypothetical protein
LTPGTEQTIQVLRGVSSGPKNLVVATGEPLMRRTLVLVGVVAALLAITAPDAEAAGPFCFSIPPFTDVFVWFLNPTGANQFAGSGRDLSGDRAQTVSGFVTGNAAVVGYTTYPNSSDFSPVNGGGTIDLGSGTGPGTCFGPDFADCGDFTFATIACPPDATADPAPGPGRVQGRNP